MTEVKRIAVPTVGSLGMNDVVSSVFSRAPNFTLIDIVDREVSSARVVKVEENAASKLKQGSGPIVAKYLKDKGVKAVIVGELGPGASTLLDLSGIKALRVEPGVKVSLALKKALKEL